MPKGPDVDGTQFPPVPTFDIVADDVRKLSRVGNEIKASRLKMKAVVILLHHIAGLSQRGMVKVLDALPQLEKEYLK